MVIIILRQLQDAWNLPGFYSHGTKSSFQAWMTWNIPHSSSVNDFKSCSSEVCWGLALTIISTRPLTNLLSKYITWGLLLSHGQRNAYDKALRTKVCSHAKNDEPLQTLLCFFSTYSLLFVIFPNDWTILSICAWSGPSALWACQ